MSIATSELSVWSADVCYNRTNADIARCVSEKNICTSKSSLWNYMRIGWFTFFDLRGTSTWISWYIFEIRWSRAESTAVLRFIQLCWSPACVPSQEDRLRTSERKNDFFEILLRCFREARTDPLGSSVNNLVSDLLLLSFSRATHRRLHASCLLSANDIYLYTRTGLMWYWWWAFYSDGQITNQILSNQIKSE